VESAADLVVIGLVRRDHAAEHVDVHRVKDVRATPGGAGCRLVVGDDGIGQLHAADVEGTGGLDHEAPAELLGIISIADDVDVDERERLVGRQHRVHEVEVAGRVVARNRDRGAGAIDDDLARDIERRLEFDRAAQTGCEGDEVAPGEQHLVVRVDDCLTEAAGTSVVERRHLEGRRRGGTGRYDGPRGTEGYGDDTRPQPTEGAAGGS
jgi:hypothetical protein